MKEQVVNELLNIIYRTKTKPLLSQDDINYINNYYKNNYKNHLTINDYLSSNLKNKKLIESQDAILAEIESKITIQKALQPGIITECNLSSFIASILGLNNCYILRNNITAPAFISGILKKGNLAINKCRYVYYGDDKTNYLFQYGDPQSCDAILFFKDEFVNIEYKERMAKAGEYDLGYNEKGKLFLTEKFKRQKPELIYSLQPMLDSFNKETNLYAYLGSNFKNFDEQTKLQAIRGYFKAKKIDILISQDASEEVVAIIPEWIGNNTLTVVSAEGSEIRTTGKNPTALQYPEVFKKMYISNGGRIKNNTCYIDVHNKLLRTAKSRGKTEIGLLKISSIYEVPLKGTNAAVLKNGYYIFPFNSIREKKPTVSPHITITSNKVEIINKLLNKKMHQTAEGASKTNCMIKQTERNNDTIKKLDINDKDLLAKLQKANYADEDNYQALFSLYKKAYYGDREALANKMYPLLRIAQMQRAKHK